MLQRCYKQLIKTSRSFSIYPILNQQQFSNTENRDKLVWIDCEMTGLDIEKDKILEISVVVTSGKLDIIAQMEPMKSLVIQATKQEMEEMNDWCKINHKESGLIEECLQSSTSMQEAEEKILNFLSGFVDKGYAPLCGNSVHVDRLFLRKCMPKLEQYLHYRIIDVSSIKEVVGRWYPRAYSYRYYLDNVKKREKVIHPTSEVPPQLENPKQETIPTADSAVVDIMKLIEKQGGKATITQVATPTMTTSNGTTANGSTHRAYADILGSIEELKFYQKYFFTPVKSIKF